MTLFSNRHVERFFVLTILFLAIPAIAIRIWLTFNFPSYLGWQFVQDVLFALAFCSLLALVTRWRLLGSISWPFALVLFVVWLALVFSEGVSYYLQADTFNDRFFANIDPNNLRTGIHAFPWMIGGGLITLLVLLGVAGWLLRKSSMMGQESARGASTLFKMGTIIGLTVLVVVLNSAPHRLVKYFLRYEKSSTVADSPAARSVYQKINADPVSHNRLRASPGRNVVILYLESLERLYTDQKVFPELTPNLNRLRKQGLDFPGLETFSGATYTIAGMFASQCGAPLFSSPFAAFDDAAGNNNSAGTFHPRLVCLGDVLHAAGYEQVYMGGAPMSFSNKDLFYKLHGYDQGLGLDELEAAHGGKLQKEGWGLYDRELFKLALEQFRKLEKSGKPFNLSMITLDTHPPHGRPSPDCPRYAQSDNDVLQATHCTDYLVGRFIDELSKEPDFKNTVVLVMSDHLEMRNDAESLYPEGYHRQPLLFFLNAGHGQRLTRIYHMDIAPILLDLMGVRTNATFIAGADRSAVGAANNPLVDDEVTRAVLRETLWSKNGSLRLCKDDSLLGWTPENEFRIGGRVLPMDNHGLGQVAPTSDQVLTFFVSHENASLIIAGRDSLTGLLAQRGDASALMIRPRYDPGLHTGLFSVDWMGLHGAVAHIADVPRLQGLAVTSSQCKELMTRADNAKAGTALDYSKRFSVSTAPRFPELAPSPATVNFNKDQQIRPYRGEIGWHAPEPWGSWTIGDKAYLEFSLPAKQCHQAELQFLVHPFVPESRPNLDVSIVVNGKPMTAWHFHRGQPVDQIVTTPVTTDDGKCRVNMRFDFTRPGSKTPPYPAGEDPRALQLDFKELRVREVTKSPAR